MQERFKLIPAVFSFFIRNEEILLLLRANTGWGDGEYSLIAGHVDGDESATTAMIREAEEESGIKIKPEDLSLVLTMHLRTNEERICLFFEVKKWEGEIKNMEPHKCAEIKWFPISNLPPNIVFYIRKAIECYIKKMNYCEIGWDILS